METNWLKGLDPATRERVFVVMRALGAEAETYYEKARIPGGRVPVGAACFDDFIQGYARECVCRYLNKGFDPLQVRAQASTDIFDSVKKHNQQRTKDYNWARWEHHGADTVCALVARIERALEAPPAPVVKEVVKVAKGSTYEREICTAFSLWWTDGKRDDVFWRAAGSGNRAKVRGRAGRGTAGQNGDICATDPIGAVLIDLFTIEIKRGYSKNTIQDLIDKPDRAGVQVWDSFFDQILESYDQAGSYSWLLINRRDRREAMVWFPRHVIADLQRVGALKNKPTPYAGIVCTVRRGNGKYEKLDLAGMRLKDWLAAVTPAQLKALAKEV